MNSTEISDDIPIRKDYSAQINKNMIYIFGGYDDEGLALKDLYAFDVMFQRGEFIKLSNCNFNDIIENNK